MMNKNLIILCIIILLIIVYLFCFIMSEVHKIITHSQHKHPILLAIIKKNKSTDLTNFKSSFINNSTPFKNIIHNVYNDFTRRSPIKSCCAIQITQRSSVFDNDHIFKQHLHREQFQREKGSLKKMGLNNTILLNNKHKGDVSRLREELFGKERKNIIVLRKNTKRRNNLNQLITSMISSKVIENKTDKDINKTPKDSGKIKRYRENQDSMPTNIFKKYITESESNKHYIHNHLQKDGSFKSNKCMIMKYKAQPDDSHNLSSSPQKIKTQPNIKGNQYIKFKTDCSKDLLAQVNPSIYKINITDKDQMNKTESLNPWANMYQHGPLNSINPVESIFYLQS